MGKPTLPTFKFEDDDDTDKCNESPISDDEIQQCKLSYKYSTLKLIPAVMALGTEHVMVKFHVSVDDQDTRVTFNRSTFMPDMVYLINPGGFSTIEKNNKTVFSKEQWYPIFREKEKGVGVDIDGGTQHLIISHTSRSGGSDILWLVIPIRMSIIDTNSLEKDESVESGGRPSESALIQMVEQWVQNTESGISEHIGTTGQVDPTGKVRRPKLLHVDLNDMIPVKGDRPKSPYVYINYEDYTRSSMTHHILYFKEDHSLERYNLGAIDSYHETREKIQGLSDEELKSVNLYEKRSERDNDETLKMSVFDSNGNEPLLRNLDKRVSTRKKIGMKCRPIKVGGEKYADQYELVQDKKKANADTVLSSNKFFGFSFVVLVLMILLVPVAVHYLVKPR